MIINFLIVLNLLPKLCDFFKYTERVYNSMIGDLSIDNIPKEIFERLHCLTKAYLIWKKENEGQEESKYYIK